MVAPDSERIWPTPAGEAASRHEHPAEWARYGFAAARAAGLRVLDCACGAGYGAQLLAKGGAQSVVGVDVDPAAVEWARQHFAAPGLEFKLGDGARLPLADGSVDLVVSFETVEHVRDQQGFVDELHRVLAPGGELVISTPLTRGAARLSPANPFHLRELDDAEFAALVSSRFQIVERLGQHSVAARRMGALQRAPAVGALLRSGLHRLLPEPVRRAARSLLGKGAPSQAAWISAERWQDAPVQIVVARRSRAGA